MEKNILITGAKGFVGRNLTVRLKELEKYELFLIDQEDSEDDLNGYLEKADVIFHLAGVNRPSDNIEFAKVNTGLTEKIISFLNISGRHPKVIFSSSIQAELDNPYGLSKRDAEDALIVFSHETGTPVRIYRLSNIFGKWCRPNYNSVVATFCHNIANSLPIQVNNPESEVSLIYIDDILKDFISRIEEETSTFSGFDYINPVFTVTLKTLSQKLYSFRAMRDTLVLPDYSDLFTKYLYTTYLSYLPENEFSYKLTSHHDDRGNLTELLKSPQLGQIFVSTTKPGITRGNHYHHTKVEKFCVIKGKGRISFRKIDCEKIVSYEVLGEQIEIVDIPPGYTHKIENTGDEEMIVLFWSNEMFSKDNPDTYFLKV
ncbi:MAG: NAD-dependent epimerase/dehydratase family protein [Ignavibacteriales bacterium]